MEEYGNLNGDFFAIVWLVVFLIIIIAAIWLVKSKKKKTEKELTSLKKQFENGELNEKEYETKKRKVLED